MTKGPDLSLIHILSCSCLYQQSLVYYFNVLWLRLFLLNALSPLISVGYLFLRILCFFDTIEITKILAIEIIYNIVVKIFKRILK